MIVNFSAAEEAALMDVAQRMCAAARTAPKAKGQDHIISAIVTGADKDALSSEMRRLADEYGFGFFNRDADNVDESAAIVLIGSSLSEGGRGLGEGCRFCRKENCADCAKSESVCVYDPLDLGIAIGSAVSVAADGRIDNRVMFSVGKAAISLGMLGKEAAMVFGIPLSIGGKSPYFDRKPKK